MTIVVEKRPRGLADVYTDLDLNQATLALLADVSDSTIIRARKKGRISLQRAKRILYALNKRAKERDPNAIPLTVKDIDWNVPED